MSDFSLEDSIENLQILLADFPEGSVRIYFTYKDVSVVAFGKEFLVTKTCSLKDILKAITTLTQSEV